MRCLLRYQGVLVGSLVRSIWDSVSGNSDDTPEVMNRANQFIQWSSNDYHQIFLDYLYDEADKPVPIRDKQMDLIVGTARANTFKEIRRYLHDTESRAKAMLGREQHG